MLHHQRTSLYELLAHVWKHSAFYREYYSGQGIREKDLIDLSVRDLPFVSKKILMDHFDSAVTDPRIRQGPLQQWAQDNPGQVRYKEFLVNCTSGSSGDIGIFVYDQTAVNVMNGRMVERLPAPENYPSGKTRCACFMHTAAALMPKAIFETAVLSLLDSSEEVVGRLNAFQPHRLTGYSSHLANLADMALQGKLHIRPESLLATGDLLTESMEHKIRAAWNAPLYELYCASESIHLGVKTGGGEMRIMDDLNIVELLDDLNWPAPSGGLGRVVLTNLYNYTLPVLRYELGDYAVRGTEGSETAFSTIRKIRGRINDALPVLLGDGSVGSIHPVALADFYVAGLDKLQFVSVAPHRLRIDYVAPQDITGALGREFQLILDRARAGKTAFEVRRVEQIPNDALTGKFRLVRVHKPADEPAIAVSTRGAPKQSGTLPSAPISAQERRGTMPLSFSQQRAWFIEKLAPGSLYHVSRAFRLKGALDHAALERSINEIIKRHEILRTGFSEQQGGEAVQVVVPEASLKLSPVDISAARGDEAAEMSRWARAEIERPFDLAAAPLMRAALFRGAADDHLLVLVLHHIISDAWSMNVLLRELSTFYKLFSSGDGTAFPELAIQYGDFAQWRREPAQRRIFDSQLGYWKDRLAGAPHDLEVPMDFPRRALPSHRGGKTRIALGADFCRAIKTVADSERSTRFMLLAAAFQALIYRLTGHQDVVIGSTISGRNQDQTHPLIGFFVNVLVLRANCSGEATFKDLLRQVKTTCLEAYSHQDLPFELLVKELRPERHANRNPLFQCLINMHNLPDQVLDLPDLTVHPVEASADKATYDLELVVSQRNREITLSLLYAADLFSAERAREMLRQYKYLLEQIVDNPDEQIDRYSLVTETGRRALPDPTKPLDRTWHGSVQQFFSDYARRNPDRLAVVDAHGAIGYGDLDRRSSRLANYLLDHGIGRDDVVAIYGDRSAALVWALLGILKAGAAFLILDPAFPAARLKAYMSQARPAAWLQLEGAGHPPRELETCLAEFSCRCRLALPNFAEAAAGGLLANYSDKNPEITIRPGQLAYLAFTSGTTGKPKAVLGEHDSLTHFIPWLRRSFDLKESDRFSVLSGLSSNLLQREIFTALCSGSALCMPEPEAIADTPLLLNWLRRNAITVVHMAPAAAWLWADFGAAPLLPAVRSVFFGGDKLHRRDVEVIRRAAPAATIASFYGATETQRAVGCYVVRGEREEQNFNASREDELSRPLPLGQEMPDVDLLVMNKVERLAAPGELGEICVRSPHIAKGYLDDPELTLARFTANPFTNDPADRIYKTGELGRFRPDGNIDFVARSQSRVNIRGHRIELGEIEAALREHPAVRENVVVPGNIPDEGVIAYVALKQGHRAGTSELRGAVKDQLPDHMVPSTFVILDSLPRTPNGKVDRRALPLPDRHRPDLKNVFVAPRTPAERSIAGLWAHLLRVERIGIHDNFFDLGGHSLLAMQFIAHFRDAFRVELPLRALFDNPTIEGIAFELVKIRAGGTEGLSLMVADLESLSNEELEAELAGPKH